MIYFLATSRLTFDDLLSFVKSYSRPKADNISVKPFISP